MSPNDQRPWEQIPNPFGFLPVSEQLKQIHSPQGPGSGKRTAPFAKDWLGQSFTKGDLLIGTRLQSNGLFEVDEIVLDDGKGNPYQGYSYGLHLNTRDHQLYWASHPYDPLKNARLTAVQLIDPSWISPHLGLFAPSRRSFYYDIPPEFTALAFQSFRVRVKPVDGDPKRRSLGPDQITAVGGAPLTRELSELHLQALKIPFLGDPIVL